MFKLYYATQDPSKFSYNIVLNNRQNNNQFIVHASTQSTTTYFYLNQIRHYLLICLIVFLSIIATTQDSIAEPNKRYLEAYYSDAIRGHLAEKDSWLSLIHYRQNTFTNNYYSEIDGKEFFFAEAGRRHPSDELFATIEAMHRDVVRESNLHPQCQFPARLTFLKNNISGFGPNLPAVKCRQYLEWRHFLNAESLSLVFTSPNVGNSGSIFGNSFLKINPPKLHKNVFNKDKNVLPAKAISYALDVDAEQQDEWFHTIKAAFGKYPGKITIESYVNRVARYKNSENRDIWEYQLNLSPLETEQLLEHVWELKHSKIDYYYLDENSAYLMLSLIDTVKPQLNLADSFSLQVLPVDTIRLLIDKEIISSINYIPSTLTNLKYHYSKYSSSEQDIVLGLIDGSIAPTDPEFSELAATVKVFVLEVANQYLQLSFKRGEIDRISYKVRSLRLRKTRKKLNAEIELADAPPPGIRPDQGHKTSHLTAGVGQNDSKNFIELNWRPALHGLLDSDSSYDDGIQISYLDTAVRLDDDNGFVLIDRLHLISLYSLRARNSLFTPWSFKFKAGLDRDSVFSQPENLYFNINGGAGLSFQITKPVLVYGLVEATMIIDKRFDNKVSFAAGPNIGALWQITNAWKLWLDSSTQYYDDQNNNNIIEKHSLGLSYAINKNRVLTLSLIKQGIQDFTKQENKLSLTWFY